MFESINPLYFYPYSNEEENEYRKNEKQELFTPREGTLYGNLFKKEYKPYKNYVPKLRSPKNDRERILLEIAFYSNAAHDLELYLDVVPSHKEYITIYKEYVKKCEELEDEYVKKYGPISPTQGTEKNGLYNYVTTPSVWLI